MRRLALVRERVLLLQSQHTTYTLASCTETWAMGLRKVACFVGYMRLHV